MNRKIINGIISLAIVIAALYGLSRLRFIERSIWIFKTNDMQNTRRGGPERGGEGRDFRARPQDFGRQERINFENLPDSVRQRLIAERGARFENDSTRERQAQNVTRGRGDFRGRGQGRDFRKGSSIRLANVSWFFIVFAGFTVVTIYLDMLTKWIKRK